MMNIDRLNDVITFNDVFEGQFFVTNGTIYLKTEVIVDEDENEYNAVNTKNGFHCYFDEYTTVSKVLKGAYTVNFD